MTNLHNIDRLEAAWISERKALRAKIEELNETIYALRQGPASEVGEVGAVPLERMTFPPDLPLPFNGQRIWHHLFIHRGAVIRYDELQRRFCGPACRWPKRSIQTSVSKINRHLRDHLLRGKYGITTVAKVGYVIRGVI